MVIDLLLAILVVRGWLAAAPPQGTLLCALVSTAVTIVAVVGRSRCDALSRTCAVLAACVIGFALVGTGVLTMRHGYQACQRLVPFDAVVTVQREVDVLHEAVSCHFLTRDGRNATTRVGVWDVVRLHGGD